MNCNDNYGVYNSTPTLKVYRKELLLDDGLISVYLDISSKMAYCKGYLKFHNLDGRSAYEHPEIGSWIGFDNNVYEYLPDYADFILHKLTNKPFKKWNKKSKLLKILCDLGFASVEVDTKKTRKKKTVDYYIVKIKDYVDINKETSWKTTTNRLATTKNGFFFVNRSTILKLSAYWSIFTSHAYLDDLTKINRKSALKEIEIPKEVKKAIMSLDRTDKTKYFFSTFDAYYDMMFSTVFNDATVKGSNLGALVSLNSQPITTCQALADRWGWSKAKVSRFFKNNQAFCSAFHLSNNKGTVIYLNQFISTQSRNKNNEFVEDVIPEADKVIANFSSDAENCKKGVLKSITEKFVSCGKAVLKKIGFIFNSDSLIENEFCSNRPPISDMTDEEFYSFIANNMPLDDVPPDICFDYFEPDYDYESYNPIFYPPDQLSYCT